MNEKIFKLLEENPGADPEELTDQVYEEELGFGLFFMMEVLLPILHEERPAEKAFRGFNSGPFILEYLRLKLKHPEKNEEELIELFRLSARERNISMKPGEERPSLDTKD